MSFGSVCTCLLRATARNLAVQQARRLRSARYAVPAVLAAVYLGVGDLVEPEKLDPGDL